MLSERESELSCFCLVATILFRWKTGQDSVRASIHFLTKVFVWLRACMTAQILVAVLTLSCASCKVKCINSYIWCNDCTAVLVASSMLKACPAACIVFHSCFTLLHCHGSHKVSFTYTKGHRMLTNQNPSKINCCQWVQNNEMLGDLFPSRSLFHSPSGLVWQGHMDYTGTPGQIYTFKAVTSQTF